MKKTLNVNIGSIAFVIDEDAFNMLNRYLEDVESRCEPSEAKDTINDIEMRIAEIFSENIASPRQVINTDMVKMAIGIIGKAEEFGDKKDDFRSSKTFSDIKRIRRSRKDRVLGGICGGISEYFGIDVAIVRILTFLLVFFGGLSLWVYIILWIFIPEEEL